MPAYYKSAVATQRGVEWPQVRVLHECQDVTGEAQDGKSDKQTLQRMISPLV